MQRRIALLVFSFGIFWLSGTAYSRPQYAIRRKIVSCMACHFNPAGGGPRNVFGKSALSHRGKLSGYSKQDLVHIDWRAINIDPVKDKNENPTGTGIMSSTASVAIPVLLEEDGSELHAILSNDFGGFGKGARETFVRHTGISDSLKSVVVGKFNIPFGLLTDEHRTYTRKQTNTSLNTFEMGAMISGDPQYSIHYDFAFVEGYQKSAAYPDAGQNYGAVFNVRSNFNSSPLMLGLSGLYYKGQIDTTTSEPKEEHPWATSLYGGLSLDHMTNNTLKGSFMFEMVWAKYFNRSDFNGQISYFVNGSSSPTYFNDIADKQSLGFMGRFDLVLSKKWNVFYKLDAFAPDQNHMKDQFILSTVGFKYYYMSNIDFDLRYESTEVRREGIKETGVSSGKDKVLLLGRIWI